MTLHNKTALIGVAIFCVAVFALILALSSVSSVASDLAAVTTETPPHTTDTPTTAPVPIEPPRPVTVLDFRSNGNGTCALTGIGNCADASVVIPETSPSGDRVTSIASQAFYGVPTLTAVHIPATVTFIGSLAFAECKNLAYVSVSDENNAYCDENGVLYSADRSTLILYPPKRAGEAFTLQTETTVIREMAFFECAYLKRIVFNGSAEQWQSISVGTKNYALLAASKEFAK